MGRTSVIAGLAASDLCVVNDEIPPPESARLDWQAATSVMTMLRKNSRILWMATIKEKDINRVLREATLWKLTAFIISSISETVARCYS